MDVQHQEVEAPPSLAAYDTLGVWLQNHAGPFFSTRASLNWFVKENHNELIELGALIPGKGRRASLVQREQFSRAVVSILKRRSRA